MLDSAHYEFMYNCYLKLNKNVPLVRHHIKQVRK